MLNYTQMTYLTNGCSISLLSQKTKTYLALDTETYKFNLKGIHPFLENKEVKTSLTNQSKLYLFSSEDPKSKNVILYGSTVCIMTQEEYFLCGANNGDLILERLNGNGIMATSNLPPNSKFTILDGFNIDNSMKPICYDDDIILRSSFGYYLVIDSMDFEMYNNFSAVSCSASMLSEECVFKFINSEVPFVPDWCNKRKYLNYNNTSYLYQELNVKEKAKIAASKKKSFLNNVNSQDKENYILDNQKIPLMSRDKKSQEDSLLEDLLLNLIGFEGNYIKRNKDREFNDEESKEKELIVTNLLFNNNSNNKSLIKAKLDLLKNNNKLEEEVKKYVNKFEIEPYLDNPTSGKYINFKY